jgi:DNA gyrase subunit A
MAYAASRYTEAKLDSFCAEIFKDADKDTVDFVDNYDGRLKEPVLLPVTFPNLLVTPTQGIAVGMASSICSFNLKEVCAAAIAMIKDPNADALKNISGPDFASGGQFIFVEKDFRAICETGRGSFKLKAKWSHDKKNNIIEVTEIPYTTTVEAIVDKIAALVKAGKLREVNDARDETDISGLKIAIDIKKSANPEMTMSKLFAQTPLMDGFNCNFNALVDGSPRVMGVSEIISQWLRFRVKCVTRRTSRELEKADEKRHLLEGLSKAALDIDRAIAIIRGTEDDKSVVPNLMSGFGIDKDQAEFVAEIKLRNLNRQYILSRLSELEGLQKEIGELKAILASDDRVKAIIAKELSDVAKKYGKPRKTEVIRETGQAEFSGEDFIDDYAVRIFVTGHGYFKKISLVSLRSSGEQFLKDDDYISREIETTNKSDLLFFSDKRCVYKIKAYETPDSKASALGEYMPNMLKLDEGERIVFVMSATDYDGFVIFGFQNGKVAKIALSAYATKTNRRKLLNAYSDKSPLIFADYIRGDADYAALRDSDKAAIFNTAALPLNETKNAAGVQVISLRRGGAMTAMIPAGKFVSDDAEYYRAHRIPTTGHFLTEKDKEQNGMDGQLTL